MHACKETNNFTPSFIQRSFKIGYAHAGAIKDAFIEDGIIEEDTKRTSMDRGKDDPLYAEAIAACKEHNKFTVEQIQHSDCIGYARAEAILNAYFQEKSETK